MEAEHEDSQGVPSKNSVIKRSNGSESPDYKVYKDSIKKEL